MDRDEAIWNHQVSIEIIEQQCDEIGVAYPAEYVRLIRHKAVLEKQLELIINSGTINLEFADDPDLSNRLNYLAEYKADN